MYRLCCHAMPSLQRGNHDLPTYLQAQFQILSGAERLEVLEDRLQAPEGGCAQQVWS